MAAKSSFTGDKQLQALMGDLLVNKSQKTPMMKVLRQAMRDAMKIALKDAKQELRARAPARRGRRRAGTGRPVGWHRRRLAAGLTVRALKRSRVRIGVRIVTPGRDRLGIKKQERYYWPAALEFGTVKMAARPFLRPALDRNKNRMKRRTARRVNVGLRRIARKHRPRRVAA